MGRVKEEKRRREKIPEEKEQEERDAGAGKVETSPYTACFLVTCGSAEG